MGLELRLAWSGARLILGWGGDVCLEVATHLGGQSSGGLDRVCMGLAPRLARVGGEQGWGRVGACLEVAVHLGRQPWGGDSAHTTPHKSPVWARAAGEGGADCASTRLALGP